MIQYTVTYRIKVTIETKVKLVQLKSKYRIFPAAFIRQAIEEKLARDLPKLKAKKERITLPF